MLRLTLRLELSLSNPSSFQILKTREIWTFETTSNDFSVNYAEYYNVQKYSYSFSNRIETKMKIFAALNVSTIAILNSIMQY